MPIPDSRLSSVAPALARLLARGVAVSSDQLEVLLLSLDVEAFDSALHELAMWVKLLSRVPALSEVDGGGTVVEALALRNVPRDIAQLAVSILLSTNEPHSDSEMSIDELERMIAPASEIVASFESGDWEGSEQEVDDARGRIYELRERVMRIKMKDKVTDRGLLEEAFHQLTQMGYHAEPNFYSAGFARYWDMPVSLEQNPCDLYVFWTGDSDETAFEVDESDGYDLVSPLNLKWGGDAGLILKVISSSGFWQRVVHNGDLEKAIQILP